MTIRKPFLQKDLSLFLVSLTISFASLAFGQAPSDDFEELAESLEKIHFRVLAYRLGHHGQRIKLSVEDLETVKEALEVDKPDSIRIRAFTIWHSSTDFDAERLRSHYLGSRNCRDVEELKEVLEVVMRVEALRVRNQDRLLKYHYLTPGERADIRQYHTNRFVNTAGKYRVSIYLEPNSMIRALAAIYLIGMDAEERENLFNLAAFRDPSNNPKDLVTVLMLGFRQGLGSTKWLVHWVLKEDNTPIKFRRAALDGLLDFPEKHQLSYRQVIALRNATSRNDQGWDAAGEDYRRNRRLAHLARKFA